MLIYKINSKTVFVNQVVTGVFLLLGLIIGGSFGAISASGNYLLITMSASLLLGFFMIQRPDWIIWVVLFLGLLVIGVMPLFLPALENKAGWGVSVLGFVLFAIALYRLITSAEARACTPNFVWTLLLIFVYVITVSIARFYNMEEFSGAFKRYFQMWGLVFALAWLDFSRIQVRQWYIFMLLVTFIQLPFALYELIVWVPIRIGMQNASPGMVPVDVVAGTFGASIDGGGNSGEMASFLVMIFSFLLARKKMQLLSLSKFIGLSLLVLAPLGIAETKAVMVMIPLAVFGVYYRDLILRPLIAVLLVVFMCVFLMLMVQVYAEITGQTVEFMLNDIMKYNVGNEGYGAYALNRTTVLSFWEEHQGLHDPLGLIFGNGLGSAHDSPLAVSGHIAARYPGYGIGLTATALLLWETGLLGFGMVLMFLGQIWSTSGRIFMQTENPAIKADVSALQSCVIVLFFDLFYANAFVETVVFQIAFTAIIGYLAFLYRQNSLVLQSAVS